MRFFSEHIAFDSEIPMLIRDMLFTPETSGGLLVAIDSKMVDLFQEQCTGSIVVGDVISGEGRIHVLP